MKLILIVFAVEHCSFAEFMGLNTIYLFKLHMVELLVWVKLHYMYVFVNICLHIVFL